VQPLELVLQQRGRVRASYPVRSRSSVSRRALVELGYRGLIIRAPKALQNQCYDFLATKVAINCASGFGTGK
jgi:hypothetical protein